MKKIGGVVVVLLALAAILYGLLSDGETPETLPGGATPQVDETERDAPVTPSFGSDRPDAPGEATQVREEVQRTAAALRGTVIDTDTGLPLPAVPLSLLHADGKSTSGKSDGDGHFLFASLDPGTYQLEPGSDGDLDYQAEPLDVELTEKETAVELVVERAWFLRGKVVEQGSRLPAGQLRLVARIEDGGQSFLANTAADGSFRSQIAFTATTLRISLSESGINGLVRIPQSGPELARVEVGREDVSSLLIELPWTGVVHGVVLDDLSRPVADAEVRVLAADSIYLKIPSLRFWARESQGGRTRQGRKSLTDRFGRFRFQHLPNDRRLALIVRARGFAVACTPDLDPPFVADGPAVEIRLESAGSIVGQLLSESGEPIDKAMVSAVPEIDGHQPDPTWTKAGEFRLDHLAPGEYQVSAEQGSGLSRRIVASGEAEVHAGEETALLLRAGVDGAHISGVAVDQNGLNITADRGALLLRCNLDGAAPGEEPWRPDTAIEADGTFDIMVTHPGRKYRLTLISGAAGDTWETQVVEAPASDLRLTFTLVPLHSLKVRALDALTGELLDQGNISISWDRGSKGMNFFGGERSIAMREGRYTITVDVADYAPASRELVFADTTEQETLAEMRLGRGRSVEGRVLDAAGRPAKGCSVMLMSEDGLQTRSLVYSGPDGRFTLASAPLSGGSACVIDEHYRVLTRAEIGAGDVVLVLPDP